MPKTLMELFLDYQRKETDDRMRGNPPSKETIDANDAFHKRVEELLERGVSDEREEDP